MNPSKKMMVEAANLLNQIDNEVRKEFDSHRTQRSHTTTKGLNYEDIVNEALTKYLGAHFEFSTRAEIIDNELEFINVFPEEGSNQFDVVASFKTSIPRLIFEMRNTKVVPLDSVAFIIEVAQTLEKGKLEKDLKKFAKLDKLKIYEERLGIRVQGDYVIERPIKILFYYEKEIDDETLKQLMQDFSPNWDLLIIFKDDKLWLNPNLPFVKKFYGSEEPYLEQAHSLLKLIIVLSVSIPVPISVNTLPVFQNLLDLNENTSFKSNSP